MASLLSCGFECGIAPKALHFQSSAGIHLQHVATRPRTGRLSARAVFAGQNARTKALTIGGPHNHLVGRCYINFKTLPSANTYFLWVGATFTDRMGLGFKQSTGTIHCTRDNPSVFAGSGFTPSLDTWYQIDFKFDQTPGAKTFDCTITEDTPGAGANVLTQAAWTGAGAKSDFQIGSEEGGAGVTGEWFFDDFDLDDDLTTYPIGAGFVQALLPFQDVTHNITADFKRGSTATSIDNSTTDSYLLINKAQQPTTPDGNNYINQPNIGATDYVEHRFTAAPGDPAVIAAPRGVSLLGSWNMENINASADLAEVKLVDNASVDKIAGLSQPSNTDIHHFAKHYGEMVGGGAWTLSRFSALKVRFGYSATIALDKYLHGLMIEAGFLGIFGGDSGNIKVWNGVAWIPKPVKIYNNPIWGKKPLKIWNGSAWVPTPY